MVTASSSVPFILSPKTQRMRCNRPRHCAVYLSVMLVSDRKEVLRCEIVSSYAINKNDILKTSTYIAFNTFDVVYIKKDKISFRFSKYFIRVQNKLE